MKKSKSTSLPASVRKFLSEAKRDANLMKKMKALGATDREIAIALGISEDDVEILT